MATRFEREVVLAQLIALLQEGPLFVWDSLPDGVGRDTPHPIEMPGRLELICRVCKRSRPFEQHVTREEAMAHQRAISLAGDLVGLLPGTHVARFKCIACKLGFATFLLELRGDKPPYQIRKVGQSPELPVTLAPELEQLLGEPDLALMRKAKVSLVNGYGMGACAYLRRILEDRVDDLLRLMRLGRDATEVAKLDRIIAGKNADDKLAKALELCPASIIVDGSNPLRVLHDIFSKGLHKLSEEECVRVAQQAMAALEVVVVELSRQTKMRKQYTDQIRAVDRARRPGKAKRAT